MKKLSPKTEGEKADPGLRKLMLEDLARSGLDEKDAELQQLRPVSADEAERLGFEHRAGYVIPYFGVDGKPLNFERIRYLDGADPKYGQRSYPTEED